MKKGIERTNFNLKSLALLGLMIALPSLASAQVYEVNRVLKDGTTLVALDLNESTVFCTERGYGTIQLKISVPELDFLAHFDHRVVGERLPCITGGLCTELLSPSGIIDPQEPIAVVPVRVILEEKLSINPEANTCQRTLNETIKSYIRGHAFTHFRSGQPQDLAIAKCLKVQDN